MIYSPDGLMRYNDSNAIVDDMPLLSQWIKKSKSKDLDFLVGEGGFGPPKHDATDLQSAPFGHSGTRPYSVPRQEKRWSWWTDLNPRPADYKSAALPAELHQQFLTLDYYITSFGKMQGGICEKSFTFHVSPAFYLEEERADRKIGRKNEFFPQFTLQTDLSVLY